MRRARRNLLLHRQRARRSPAAARRRRLRVPSA